MDFTKVEDLIWYQFKNKLFLKEALTHKSNDENFNRLGYGGGFYDRYIEKIEKIKKVIKIGLAFSYQKLESIPINKYDKKLDFIITEKEILK